MEIEGRRVYIVTGRKTQTVNICKADNERGEYDYIYRFTQPSVIRPDEIDEDFSLGQLRDWLVRHGGKEERRPTGVARATSSPSSSGVRSDRPTGDRRDVFVVHGRDMDAQNAMFAFLRAIDLRPLEWDTLVVETRKGSPYIGEVLDVAFRRAQAVVVLFTPDDEARLRSEFRRPNDPAYESKLSGQPRANVIFEAGIALATQPDRTILVEIGDLRPWSDVAGRHVVRVAGDSIGLHTLANRLRSAGCAVRTDGSQWLDTRPFVALSQRQEAARASSSGDVQ